MWEGWRLLSHSHSCLNWSASKLSLLCSFCLLNRHQDIHSCLAVMFTSSFAFMFLNGFLFQPLFAILSLFGLFGVSLAIFFYSFRLCNHYTLGYCVGFYKTRKAPNTGCQHKSAGHLTFTVGQFWSRLVCACVCVLSGKTYIQLLCSIWWPVFYLMTFIVADMHMLTTVKWKTPAFVMCSSV